MAGTLLACIVGFTVAGFFVSLGYSTILYLLLGLTLGFFKLLNQTGEGPIPVQGGLRRRRA
jgi:F0F1-type ATP synthase assembly protein I